MTEFTELMVCNSSFKTNADIPHDVIEELNTTAPIFIQRNEISLKPFERHHYLRFLEQLAKVRDTLKLHKISFSPKIVVVLYDANGEGVGAQIKTTLKEIKIDTGNIKISFAKEDKATKAKTLTIEEKIALVREWRNLHPNEIPQPNEKFNNFAIGKFYVKACTDANLKAQLDQILNES